jgi:hypothetical protein
VLVHVRGWSGTGDKGDACAWGDGESKVMFRRGVLTCVQQERARVKMSSIPMPYRSVSSPPILVISFPAADREPFPICDYTITVQQQRPTEKMSEIEPYHIFHPRKCTTHHNIHPGV